MCPEWFHWLGSPLTSSSKMDPCTSSFPQPELTVLKALSNKLLKRKKQANVKLLFLASAKAMASSACNWFLQQPMSYDLMSKTSRVMEWVTGHGRTPKENIDLHCSQSEEVELIRLYAVSAGFVERLLVYPACKDTSLLCVVFVLLWKARRPEPCWSHCILQLSFRVLSEMVHCYVCASIWTFQVRPWVTNGARRVVGVVDDPLQVQNLHVRVCCLTFHLDRVRWADNVHVCGLGLHQLSPIWVLSTVGALLMLGVSVMKGLITVWLSTKFWPFTGCNE